MVKGQRIDVHDNKYKMSCIDGWRHENEDMRFAMKFQELVPTMGNLTKKFDLIPQP